MTEQLHFHFSFSCIGGNGNPLKCSCLEHPRDGGAWWAAVCEVAQSRTRLKRLSSSRSVACARLESPETEPALSQVVAGRENGFSGDGEEGEEAAIT